MTPEDISKLKTYLIAQRVNMLKACRALIAAGHDDDVLVEGVSPHLRHHVLSHDQCRSGLQQFSLNRSHDLRIVGNPFINASFGRQHRDTVDSHSPHELGVANGTSDDGAQSVRQLSLRVVCLASWSRGRWIAAGQ